MRYFPAFFDLRDRPVFLVGDGELAVRKARLLAKAGPRIEAFSTAEQSKLEGEFGKPIVYHRRDLSFGDLTARRPALLVVATEDSALARSAVALARTVGVPVNAVDHPAACDVVVPSIVERGDLAIGISTGGAAPVLGRRIRERIEAMLPARLGDLIAFAGRRRARVAEGVAQPERRGFWERVFAGPIAEAVYDGDAAAADRLFDAALAHQSSAEPGTIHIVGAGPGDPELLTLKALRTLQEADIVLYDNLVSEAVLDLVRRDAERRYVGKRRADHSMAQEAIGALMVSLSKEGKRVVRLKGGDPFLFGRGGEELDHIREAGLDATVVPGITAAAGAAATTAMPLTHRGLAQAVTFVTAQGGQGGAPDVNWNALAQLGQTVAVYMGVAKAAEVSRSLLEGGSPADLPAAVVENATLEHQAILRTTLGDLSRDIARAAIKGPALIVIGRVAHRANGHGLVSLPEREGIAA